ncbi:hypothetical protein BJ973_003565 [Actinoplanes tereljensis]|uniref:Concanavalin A-like lectin/glucanase superfamily protein n=1 Tax=Paractinoplanes tereljensis TaxID=571912 RepID=A0A919P003_9ACTN|nr:LamG-like jellyroll fold domain-containing protein [Actinoplanes tereljensis]GIF26924.1 hypothetical protein Ate02nite_96540 [Actinoplanes tereljensis]
MKIALALAAAAGMLIPASPALADTPGTLALVARWDFNSGATAGKVADTSGRGQALSVRTADQGVVRFEGGAAAFPATCQTGATTCARALMEAPNAADLNPGTRWFRWSARVRLTQAQLGGSANIMQKGVANAGSQWKMQLGGTAGRANCAVVGVGSPTVYIARSAGAPVTDGQWHKILCQRQGTILSIYIDNVLRGQATIPATLSISNTLPLRVGGANFNTRSDMFHGALDDVYAELG